MASETIKFNEAEGRDGFVIRQETSELNIYPSRPGQLVSDSSKVKLTNIVDYSWDMPTGIGRLVASNYTRKYIAYCVKVAGIGAVRVVDLETKDRVLMKGNRGLIRDVEFMHHQEDLFLGFIDEFGSFYVYKILKSPKLEPLLMFHVDLDVAPVRMECRRFIWCRYCPNTDEGEYVGEKPPTRRDAAAYQFAVVQDSVVYVSNLLSLISKFGEGPHKFSDIVGGFMTIREHTEGVVDASFAPDGTAIATASKDGTIKFFQIYWVSDPAEPRCLYSWSPHGGEAVSRIFFLDDNSLGNTDYESIYWKFLISAGPNMGEIKLWNCTKWECVQTLRFSTTASSMLRMEMNINGNFLILSDSDRKVELVYKLSNNWNHNQILYVMNVEHDVAKASFRWINEFSVPVSILGFSICNAQFCSMRRIAELGLENFVSEDSLEACVLDFMFVQPKSLMQASMAFTPPKEQMNGRISRISFEDSVSDRDEEKDSDGDDDAEDEEEVIEPPTKARRSLSPKTPTKILSPRSQPNVMHNVTPIRSCSPAKKPISTSVSHLTQQLSSLIGIGSPAQSRSQQPQTSFISSLLTERNDVTLPIRVRTASANGNLSNASSSPSREVEEILSPKNSEVLTKAELKSFHLDASGYVVETILDSEGNIISPDPKTPSPKINHTKHLTKTKSLGGGEFQGSGIHLPEVLSQVNSIMDMMKVQAQELKELKSEISRLHYSQQVFGSRGGDEALVQKCVEKCSNINDANFRKLEETIRACVAANDKPILPKGFSDHLTLNLAHAMKTEIETNVLPPLLKVFEPVCLHLNGEVETLIRGVELKIKQQLGQMINSHEFKSMLRDHVGTTVKNVCDGAMSDIFCTSVCPSFEKSLQGLFQTINETFMKGTKEYMTGVETSVTVSRSQHEDLQESLKRQFASIEDTLSSVLQVEVESQLRAVTTGLQESLAFHLEDALTREIQRAFQEQQRFFEVVRNVTPASSICDSTVAQSPGIDPVTRLAQLNAMIDAGDITEAFISAASMADHNILMTLAQKVSPTSVFTSDLPTAEHLSIIQQMAADITTFTETKLLYLQSAVGTLKLSDPKVLRSLTRIIPVYEASVARFARVNPGSPLIPNLKFLEMAFRGIGNRAPSNATTIPSIPTRRTQHH